MISNTYNARCNWLHFVYDTLHLSLHPLLDPEALRFRDDPLINPARAGL